MPGTDTVGLKAYGAYIPRLRLSRKAIADANAWFNPAIKGPGPRRARHLQLGRRQPDHGRGSGARLPDPGAAGGRGAAGSRGGDFRIDHACRSATGRTPAFSPRR